MVVYLETLNIFYKTKLGVIEKTTPSNIELV
jgi:hypothetical protein